MPAKAGIQINHSSIVACGEMTQEKMPAASPDSDFADRSQIDFLF
jgi:hypothetical protein